MNFEKIERLKIERSEILSSGTLEIGDYVIHLEVNAQGVVDGISEFIFRDRVFGMYTYNMKKALKAVRDWFLVYNLDTQKLYKDNDLLFALDRARKFSQILVPGIILCEQGGKLKEMSIEKLNKLVSFNERLDELEDFLKAQQQFQIGNCALVRMVSKPEDILKVKIINPVSGRSVNLHKRKQTLEKLITCSTGIPKIDNMFPLGTTQSNVVEGTFYYVAESVWEDIGNRSGSDIKFLDKNKTKEINNPKLTKLVSPSVVKRFIMPGQPLRDGKFILAGEVVDWPEDEWDGILAVTPQNLFDQMLHASGYDRKAHAVQVASPKGKGIIRAISNEEFENIWGYSAKNIPLVKDTTSRYRVSDLLKNDNKFKEVIRKAQASMEAEKQRIKGQLHSGSYIRCVFVKKSIKEPQKISKKFVCKDRNCQLSQFAIDLTICPECGSDTRPINFFTLEANEFGIFKSDREAGKKQVSVTTQMVARGNVDKKKIMSNIIYQLEELQYFADVIWYPQFMIRETKYVGDKSYTVETDIRRKILSLINVVMADPYLSGNANLIQKGIYLGHPKILGWIHNVLCKAAIDSKCRVMLKDEVFFDDKGNKTRIEFGYRLAVPPIYSSADRNPNKIRIPKKFFHMVKDGKVTIARSPVRPGGTDMATVEVDTVPSYGNVIEVDYSIWSKMGGDYDGDLAVVFPTWATGLCDQVDYPHLEGEKKADPESLEDILNLILAAASGKTNIGPVDAKITRIVTERIVSNTPLTVEEQMYLRDLLQSVITSIKWDVNTNAKAPTKLLERQLKMTANQLRNPIDYFLYFKTDSVSAVEDEEAPLSLIQSWAREHNVKLPAYPERYREWFDVLQKFGKWILTECWKTNPQFRTRVQNHPYKRIVEEFCNLNFSKLIDGKELAAVMNMYREAFQEIQEAAWLQLSESKIKDYQPILLDILGDVSDTASEYSTLTAKFASWIQDNPDTSSTKEWKKVKDYLKSKRQEIDQKITAATLDDPDNRYWLNLAVSSGVALLLRSGNKNIPFSFLYHFIPHSIFEKAFDVYRIRYGDNLDPRVEAAVASHLTS